MIIERKFELLVGVLICSTQNPINSALRGNHHLVPFPIGTPDDFVMDHVIKNLEAKNEGVVLGLVDVMFCPGMIGVGDMGEWCAGAVGSGVDRSRTTLWGQNNHGSVWIGDSEWLVLRGVVVALVWDIVVFFEAGW